MTPGERSSAEEFDRRVSPLPPDRFDLEQDGPLDDDIGLEALAIAAVTAHPHVT
jgi:hypothetical protein